MFASPRHPMVASAALRVAGVRRELFISDDWSLLSGPEGSWQIELRSSARKVELIWVEIEHALGLLAKGERLRPLIIDMRGHGRLDQATRWAMRSLLARYESGGVRLAIINDVDVIQAVRLQSALGASAPTTGRRVLSMGAALKWAMEGLPAPAVAVSPLRVEERGHVVQSARRQTQSAPVSRARS